MAQYFIRFSEKEKGTWETKPDTLEETRKLYKSLRRFRDLVEKADHVVLPEEEWRELDDLYDLDAEYDLDFDKIEIVEF